MSKELPGKDTSIWIDTTPSTHFPQLTKTNVVCDAAIVGGGIAGLLAAWFLQDAGLKTVLVEKERIIQNTTGNTTAKLTSQHYLIYDWLTKKHGAEIAQIYAEANQQAIEDIEKLAKKL